MDNEALARRGSVRDQPRSRSADALLLLSGEVRSECKQDRARDRDRLLTAEELQERTSIAKSWWLAEARLGRIPCVRAGKYVRFVFDEVLQSLRARPDEHKGSSAQP
jgi:hypothetical protein